MFRLDMDGFAYSDLKVVKRAKIWAKIEKL
jgi:hypothetical protein